MDIKVFVYGTLKKGEPNHYLLADDKNGRKKFIGNAKTNELYSLVIATDGNVPFLLDLVGVGKQIKGELYQVDEAMFQVLDKLEDYPAWYTRKVKPVTLLENGENAEAWIYFLHDFNENLRNLPTLSSYSSKGLHGRPFNIDLESNEQLSMEFLRQVKKTT